MKINKKKLIFVLPIIMITMVSTTVIRKIKNKTPKISNEKLNQKVPVEIFQVKKNILVKTFNYTGLIKLNREVMISPRVNGIISKIYVDEGDRVKKGDILATLDRHGFAYSLKPLTSIQGRLIYEHNGIYGVVFPFIEGLPPKIDKSCAGQIGEALGTLHSLEIFKEDLDVFTIIAFFFIILISLVSIIFFLSITFALIEIISTLETRL